MENVKSVDEFITGKHFHIPEYQRKYVWTEKNWTVMWDDIVTVTKDSESKRKHFIGSIIFTEEKDYLLEDEDGNTKSTTSLLIIDGQQRLTTFTLLVAAVCYFIASKSENEKTQKIINGLKDKYLFIKDISGNMNPVFRLRPSDANTEHFDEILDPLRSDRQSLPNLKDKRDNSQIIAAFCFFHDRIESYVNQQDDSVSGDQRFFNAVKIIEAYSRLSLLPMKLDQDDDPQRIFECMNNRGKSLEQSDLIHNCVLQGLSLDERKQLHINYWAKIEDFAKVRNVKGVDADRVPDFFRHYIAMRANQFIKEDDLFKTFKDINCIKDNKNNKDKMLIVLKVVRRFAKYYGLLMNSDTSQPDNQFAPILLRHFWYINQLPQATTTYPFLMRMMDDYAEHGIIEEKTLISCLELVQSYIVRNIFCGRSRRGFNKIFASLYKKAFENSEYWDKNAMGGTGWLSKKKEISSNDYVKYLKRGLGQRSEEEMMPSDKQCKEAYQKFNLYHNRIFCKYVLIRLEESLKPKGEKQLKKDGITIEHVYPRKSGQWPPIGDKGLIHSLGNLTLILNEWNSKMSNNLFCAKKVEYKKSEVHLNEYFARRTQWDDKAIKKRCEILFDQLTKIWQDIPDSCRKKQEPKLEAIADLDVRENFLIKENDHKARKIAQIKLDGKEIIDTQYAIKMNKPYAAKKIYTVIMGFLYTVLFHDLWIKSGRSRG